VIVIAALPLGQRVAAREQGAREGADGGDAEQQLH
jgi:hypothetical protein